MYTPCSEPAIFNFSAASDAQLRTCPYSRLLTPRHSLTHLLEVLGGSGSEFRLVGALTAVWPQVARPSVRIKLQQSAARHIQSSMRVLVVFPVTLTLNFK
jgi:hypothetical protein